MLEELPGKDDALELTIVGPLMTPMLGKLTPLMKGAGEVVMLVHNVVDTSLALVTELGVAVDGGSELVSLPALKPWTQPGSRHGCGGDVTADLTGYSTDVEEMLQLTSPAITRMWRRCYS
ncbi:hypothetical protein ACOMHN_047523 [Nucella lapillus]